MALNCEAERRKNLKILELDKTATDDDIKKAYKRLALQYHPDKNPDDESTTAKFQELSKAYVDLTEKKDGNAKVGFCPNHGFFCYESDEYSDDDFEDEEEEMGFFRRIFIDVFADFIFKRRFSGKKTKYTQKEQEEDSFFNFINRKYRERFEDDYEISEEDLKKFHSYDEWKKARDPRKRSNWRTRRAKKRDNSKMPKPQKPQSKKQQRSQQLKRDKESQKIGEEIMKNLKNSQKSDNTAKPAKIAPRTNFTIDPDIARELQEQEIRQREEEERSKENLKKLDAAEKNMEKRKQRQEKKVKKKQTMMEILQQKRANSESDEGIYSVSEKETPKGSTENKENDYADKIMSFKSPDKLVDNKMQEKGVKSSLLQHHFGGLEKPAVLSPQKSSPPSTQTTSSASKSGSASLLQRHMEMYNNLMKVQPQRHTEQQLRMERSKEREKNVQKQQEELERLRRQQSDNSKPSKVSTAAKEAFNKGDNFEEMRRQHLERQRELERKRNAEELKPFGGKKMYEIPKKEKEPKWYERDPKEVKPVKLKPKVNLFMPTEDPAPAPTWRPPPAVNVWQQRQQDQEVKLQAIEELLPTSEEDEEAMLRRAILLSQRAALEEQARTRYVGSVKTKTSMREMVDGTYRPPSPQCQGQSASSPDPVPPSQSTHQVVSESRFQDVLGCERIVREAPAVPVPAKGHLPAHRCTMVPQGNMSSGDAPFKSIWDIDDPVERKPAPQAFRQTVQVNSPAPRPPGQTQWQPDLNQAHKQGEWAKFARQSCQSNSQTYGSSYEAPMQTLREAVQARRHQEPATNTGHGKSQGTMSDFSYQGPSLSATHSMKPDIHDVRAKGGLELMNSNPVKSDYLQIPLRINTNTDSSSCATSTTSSLSWSQETESWDSEVEEVVMGKPIMMKDHGKERKLVNNTSVQPRPEPVQQPLLQPSPLPARVPSEQTFGKPPHGSSQHKQPVPSEQTFWKPQQGIGVQKEDAQIEETFEKPPRARFLQKQAVPVEQAVGKPQCASIFQNRAVSGEHTFGNPQAMSSLQKQTVPGQPPFGDPQAMSSLQKQTVSDQPPFGNPQAMSSLQKQTVPGQPPFGNPQAMSSLQTQTVPGQPPFGNPQAMSSLQKQTVSDQLTFGNPPAMRSLQKQTVPGQPAFAHPQHATPVFSDPRESFGSRRERNSDLCGFGSSQPSRKSTIQDTESWDSEVEDVVMAKPINDHGIERKLVDNTAMLPRPKPVPQPILQSKPLPAQVPSESPFGKPPQATSSLQKPTVPSEQTFGKPQAVSSLQKPTVSGQLAFGHPQAMSSLQKQSVPSEQTFGKPQATSSLQKQTVPSEQTFGKPQATSSLQKTTVSGQPAFGHPQAMSSLQKQSVPSEQTFGKPQATSSLQKQTVPSEQTFGKPQATSSLQKTTVSGQPAFGHPQATSSLQKPIVQSEQTFGKPQATSSLQKPTVPSEQTFGKPQAMSSLQKQTVPIEPTLGKPQATSSLQKTTLSGQPAFGNPQATSSLQKPIVPSEQTFGHPQAMSSLQKPTVPSEQTFGKPQATSSLQKPTVPSEQTFGKPQAMRSLQKQTVPSEQTFGKPQATSSLQKPTVPSEPTLGKPQAMSSPQKPTVPSEPTLGKPQATSSLQKPTVPSEPTLGKPQAMSSLQKQTVPSEQTFGKPQATSSLQKTTVPSEQTFGKPPQGIAVQSHGLRQHLGQGDRKEVQENKTFGSSKTVSGRGGFGTPNRSVGRVDVKSSNPAPSMPSRPVVTPRTAVPASSENWDDEINNDTPVTVTHTRLPGRSVLDSIRNNQSGQGGLRRPLRLPNSVLVSANRNQNNSNSNSVEVSVKQSSPKAAVARSEETMSLETGVKPEPETRHSVQTSNIQYSRQDKKKSHQPEADAHRLTTPDLKPSDGCKPVPTGRDISSKPSEKAEQTMVTTAEVPDSSARVTTGMVADNNAQSGHEEKTAAVAGEKNEGKTEGIPSGLPAHLVQAYMQYLAQSGDKSAGNVMPNYGMPFMPMPMMPQVMPYAMNPYLMMGSPLLDYSVLQQQLLMGQQPIHTQTTPQVQTGSAQTTIPHRPLLANQSNITPAADSLVERNGLSEPRQAVPGKQEEALPPLRMPKTGPLAGVTTMITRETGQQDGARPPVTNNTLQTETMPIQYRSTGQSSLPPSLNGKPPNLQNLCDASVIPPAVLKARTEAAAFPANACAGLAGASNARLSQTPGVTGLQARPHPTTGGVSARPQSDIPPHVPTTGGAPTRLSWASLAGYSEGVGRLEEEPRGDGGSGSLHERFTGLNQAGGAGTQQQAVMEESAGMPSRLQEKRNQNRAVLEMIQKLRKETDEQQGDETMTKGQRSF